jgi:hypothetical protein
LPVTLWITIHLPPAWRYWRSRSPPRKRLRPCPVRGCGRSRRAGGVGPGAGLGSGYTDYALVVLALKLASRLHSSKQNVPHNYLVLSAIHNSCKAHLVACYYFVSHKFSYIMLPQQSIICLFCVLARKRREQGFWRSMESHHTRTAINQSSRMSHNNNTVIDVTSLLRL